MQEVTSITPAYSAHKEQGERESPPPSSAVTFSVTNHQKNAQRTTGVIVMALGTPDGPDDIEAYYTRMRGGRAPTPELLSDLQRRYAAIGGRSPLLEHTRAQALGLQAALDQSEPGRYRVTLGMQHSQPTIEEGVKVLIESGVQNIVGLVLTPQYSSLSVGIYSKRLNDAAKNLLPVSIIKHWHLEPGYLQFQETALRTTLGTMTRKHQLSAERIEVIFTAHSLPLRILDMGDPYPEQVRATAEVIEQRIGLPHWSLAWQSAGRTAEPWIGPALLDCIADLPDQGRKGVIACTVGFVSEHLEILYDLDIEARQIAQQHGLVFERTAMPNDDPGFLAALANVVQKHVAASEGE